MRRPPRVADRFPQMASAICCSPPFFLNSTSPGDLPWTPRWIHHASGGFPSTRWAPRRKPCCAPHQRASTPWRLRTSRLLHLSRSGPGPRDPGVSLGTWGHDLWYHGWPWLVGKKGWSYEEMMVFVVANSCVSFWKSYQPEETSLDNLFMRITKRLQSNRMAVSQNWVLRVSTVHSSLFCIHTLYPCNVYLFPKKIYIYIYIHRYTQMCIYIYV